MKRSLPAASQKAVFLWVNLYQEGGQDWESFVQGTIVPGLKDHCDMLSEL